jgi:aminoglycoside 6'-N-acetyltransferase
MSDITFRTVTPKDLPLLKRWLSSPHWQEWWGDPEVELTQIIGNLESDSVEPMIVELDGKPIAYVQTYDPHLEDDHPYQDQPFGTIGIDISIGEASDLNKGFGAAILKALSGLLFEEGAPRLIIDPDPSNAAAIKAYSKAGFVAFGTRTSEYGPALMMALDNPNPFEEEQE